MVNSVEEARAAAHAVRFPPRGGRSGGPFGAGFHGPDYMSWIDDEVFLAVQIETARAKDHAEEIMAVPGVDGCWVGPHDLAMSMGIDRSTPKGREVHTAAIQSVIDACKRTNKIPGIATGNVVDAKRWLDRGCLFVTVGSDEGWMLEGAQQALRQLGRG
jgi:4-hydroxy-2-oxoheptanedioate aldolase